MITIVDYGVGNIGALINMFDYLGVDAKASSDPDELVAAQKLILPGVGAFGKAMSELHARRLVGPLNEAVLQRKTPILGVCLGMQLLARWSDESNVEGLGWIAATVKRIDPGQSGLKVPHIGWADVHPTRPSPLFTDEQPRFYFVHSYHMVCDNDEDRLATIRYGADLCCAVNHDNIYGMQFHPEKSHKFGMRLLTAFSQLPSPSSRT